MTVQITAKKAKSDFIAKVESLSGQSNLLSCYQCGKCSAGCPLASHMDLLPNQIIRYAQLGMKDELLASSAIWICVSCLTCNTRCPKGIKTAEIIEALRQFQLRKRHDHLKAEDISEATLKEIPPIALIGSMRKFTS
jgi:heterodisulfide reductase subunit C